MNCSKCNNKINEGQEVCLSCGHILGYESENSKKCIHCNREIPLSYKKCPYCKKKQKRKRHILKVILILIIMLINAYLLTILYSNNISFDEKTYKEKCKNVTIKELIVDNKKLEEELVSIDITITDVESTSLLFNRVLIKGKVDNHNIYIYFYNKESIGYLNNDTITVYGKYKELKGNKPIIDAKFITKK